MSWERPVWIPPLAEGGVQVWRLDLRADGLSRILVSAGELLSAAEAAHAGRLRVGRVRDEFVAARGFLRRLLGGVLDRDARELEFLPGENGKPSLAGETGLEFNVSHSRGLILVGVSRAGAVGIDVEFVDSAFADPEELLKIATTTFSADEASRVASAGDRLPGFYAAWTRGEAIAKADGCGIASPLNYRVGDADETGERAVLLARADGRGKSSYFVRNFECGLGYAAAFAGLRPSQPLRLLDGLEALYPSHPPFYR